MFKELTGYKTPTVQKINKNCSVATYQPENGAKNEGIVAISTSNKDNEGIIYLYNNTIINISNKIILSLLNNLPKSNKKVSKRKARKHK